MALDPHINPNSGVWDDNWYAQQNSNGGGSSGGGAPDYVSLAREQMKMMQEANKPAIEALQATIPTIGQRFAQTGQYLQKQVGNLESRYKNLLSSITGEKESAIQAQTTSTSQELGRRGISAQSGLFGETVNKAVLPVQRAFAGSISELGSTQQSALDQIMNQIAQLPISQTEQEQAVQQAIAQLQAGGNASAISSALSLYQQQKQNELAQQELSAKTAIDPLDQAMKELQLKQAQLDYTKSATPAATSTGDAWTNIFNTWAQRFGSVTEPKPQVVSPTTGKSTGLFDLKSLIGYGY